MSRLALAILAFPIFCPQDQEESAVTTACSTTLAKGFTFSIQPSSTMFDGLPKDRAAMIGSAFKGEFANGVFHASDGVYEVYGSNGRVAIRGAGEGWLPMDRFLAPIRQEIAQGFTGERWNRGNVTKARKAVQQAIQIAHLVHRGNPDWLENVGGAFKELKRVGVRKVDGKDAAELEGDLTDFAAYRLIQGPLEELVKRGTLVFQNVSGVGEILLQDGTVRLLHGRVGAKYSIYLEEDNTRRKGLGVLDVVVQITRVGETAVDVPKEVAQILETK